MKLAVEKRELLNVIARAQNIVEKRNTMPILVNVLLVADEKHCRGFATDLEVSLADEIQATVQSPGKVVVNAKSLFEIVKELPDGKIELERKDNNWLKISQNRSVFNIVGVSPEEYPVFPTFVTQEFVKFDRNVLSEMIEKTLFSVSTDETRYHLNGVYLEIRNDNTNGKDTPIYRMVATDGHRLSMIDRKIEGASTKNVNQGVIIPRKGLHEIRKLLDFVDETVEIAIEGAQLIVRHGTTVLMIRLIEGKYPNYQQLIPKDLKEHFLVQREALLSSLKRVSLLSNTKSKGVTFALNQGRMEITSTNPELGDAKEEIEIEYKGKDMRIGFNARFVLDVISSMHEDIVRFEFNDQLSPILLLPHEDRSYTCLIMPMRI